MVILGLCLLGFLYQVQCYQIWFGTAPFCEGNLNDCTSRGLKYVRSDKYGDGAMCVTGQKVLCEGSKKRMAEITKRSVQIWFGTAPFCGGNINDCLLRGMKVVKFDKSGDGAECITGQKVLCEGTPTHGKRSLATTKRSQQIWFGTAPFCEGNINDCLNRGMTVVRFDKYGDGAECWAGQKVLCEGTPTHGKRSVTLTKRGYQIWFGTAPFCEGNLNDCTSRGMTYVRSDKYGDGAMCVTGQKVLCEAKERKRRAIMTKRGYQIWFSTAPFCEGNLNDCISRGLKYVRSDKYGDGAMCVTGQKVL